MSEIGNVTPAKRIEWLDLARAFAIITVVLCHAKDPVLGNVADCTLAVKVFALTASTIGRLGVPFFLMITGYLLLDRDYTLESSAGFYKHSWLRLLLCTEVWFLIYDVFIKVFIDPALSVPTIIKDLLFVHKVNLGHVWYMPVILGMYLLIPLIANGLKKTSAKALRFPVAVLTLLIFVYPTVNTANNIFGFERLGLQLSLGFSGGAYGMYMIFGWLIKQGALKRIKTPVLAAVTAAAFIITVFNQVWPYSKGYTYNVWYDDLFMMTASVALFGLFSRVRKVPLSRLFKWLSVYSFGVYLVHIIARYFLLKYLIQPSGMSKPLQLLVLWVTTAAASFAAAWLIDRIPKVGKFLLYRK